LFVLTPPVRALMTWIWNGTGSLIVVALFHSAFNGTTGDALIPKLVPGHDTAWVYAVYAALALLLVVATRGRLGDRKSRATHSAPDPTDVVAMGRKEGRSMVRTIGLLIVGFVLAAGSLANTAAQGATPAPYPVAPDPAECVVARRSLEEVAAVVGTPAAGATAPVAASPTPFVRPSGEPADPATAADVTATVRQLFACTNAGDFLRVYALFTDDFLRAFLAGTPLTADVQAYFAATPVPLPTDQQRIIVRFGEAERLADGRVGLVVVLDEPDDPRTEEPDYVILVETGGRWLIEAVIEDGGLATTTP
jgi:hypothetical protein